MPPRRTDPCPTARSAKDRTPTLRHAAADPATFFRERSMQEMLHSIACEATDGAMRAYDGWRHPMLAGSAFRHDYDADVARGSWEFYRLGPGLCVVVADIVAIAAIARTHRMQDQLVLSAVIEGEIVIDDAWGATSGRIAHGHCTWYGMQGDAELHTIYEPGCPLKWVSVFIDRRELFAVTGLDADDLPGPIRDFVLHGGNLAPRSVPLSHAASLAVARIKDCPYQGGYRRTFLRAKALELACEVLFASAQPQEGEGLGAVSLAEADYDKLERAMQLIRDHLEEPFGIGELAARVGLTRQKLQLGFRLLHGDTVARVRDRLRMECALQLVREGATPMIDIAFETGYEHPASFTRAFKAAYGVSPMRMRRMAQDAGLIERLAGRRR